MIQYSCDLCKRPLDPEDDLRYVVKLEVYAAFDPVEVDDDCDHLLDIHEILERAEDDVCEEVGDDVYKQMRFDLCPDCRKRFLKNPLGRKPVEQFHFSKN